MASNSWRTEADHAVTRRDCESGCLGRLHRVVRAAM